jgi:sulfite reductase (NADPH) flavoprotein alpha-component
LPGFPATFGGAESAPGAAVAVPAQAAEMPGITLISASQTGNARRVAEALRDDLIAAQLNVKLVNAGDYKFKQIASEKLLVIVTSTQGEGESPEEAVALHKFLFSKKRRSLGYRLCGIWLRRYLLRILLPVRERL